MKTLWIGLMLCLGALPLSAQNREQTELEKFKEKLEVYLEKHKDTTHYGGDNPMVKKPDTSKYRMPTGDITSYMKDRETGLMKEYKTGQVFDPESPFIYDPEKGKIYDAKEEKYYEF